MCFAPTFKGPLHWAPIVNFRQVGLPRTLCLFSDGEQEGRHAGAHCVWCWCLVRSFAPHTPNPTPTTASDVHAPPPAHPPAPPLDETRQSPRCLGGRGASRPPAAKSVCFTAAQPMAIEAPTADPADEFPLDLLSVSMDVEFLPAPGEVRRSFFSSSDTDTDYKVCPPPSPVCPPFSTFLKKILG